MTGTAKKFGLVVVSVAFSVVAVGTNRLLGDSYAEAKQVPLESTFSSQLEHLLGQCDSLSTDRVEVLNFGVPTTTRRCVAVEAGSHTSGVVLVSAPYV